MTSIGKNCKEEGLAFAIDRSIEGFKLNLAN